MINIKMLKLLSGEEIYGEVLVDELEGDVLIINPIVLYYNEDNNLTIGAWLPYSTETQFKLSLKNLMVPPLNVHAVIEENYLKWVVEKDNNDNAEVSFH